MLSHASYKDISPIGIFLNVMLGPYIYEEHTYNIYLMGNRKVLCRTSVHVVWIAYWSATVSILEVLH